MNVLHDLPVCVNLVIRTDHRRSQNFVSVAYSCRKEYVLKLSQFFLTQNPPVWWLVGVECYVS
jgi:hypothetical protein